LQLPLDDINKTILIVDGFDPDTLAESVRTLVENFSGEELGSRICKLLTPQSSKYVPRDPNWTSEMHHQVRCSYEQAYGNSLILDLIKRKVPLKGAGINAIAYLLYGTVSKSAIDIFKELHSEQGIVFERLKGYLTRQSPRLRARVIAMYDAYFVSLKQSRPLKEAIADRVGPSENAAELISLLDEAAAELLKRENIATETASADTEAA
jgi:hypothetical protein